MRLVVYKTELQGGPRTASYWTHPTRLPPPPPRALQMHRTTQYHATHLLRCRAKPTAGVAFEGTARKTSVLDSVPALLIGGRTLRGHRVLSECRSNEEDAKHERSTKPFQCPSRHRMEFVDA